MKNNHWMFKEGERLYNFRAAGVLINGEKLLIQRGENDAEYALPGGQVEWGETGAETLVREYKEEMGADISVERLIWVEESFWQWNKQKVHSICFYYLVSLMGENQIPREGSFRSLETDESRLIFKWLNLYQLKDNNDLVIYPVFLKDKICNISDGIEHFVFRD